MRIAIRIFFQVFMSVMVTVPCVVVFAQTGQMDRELEQLYAGTNINPFDAAASNNLALKLFRQGQYERALKLLRRAQRLAPDRIHIEQNAEYLQLLMSQVRNLDMETISSLNRTYELEEIPFVPEPWGQWGSRISSADGTPQLKSQEIGGASSNPFDVDSLLVIADLKIKRGDLRGALTDLLRAKKISPWISGLDDRITRLQSLLPAGIVPQESSTELFTDPAPDSYFDNSPPPAAWPVDKPSRQYLE
jgi:tetratricopeptide (TPR) repeat protein